MDRVIIGVDPHKRSATVEAGTPARFCGRGAVRYRPGRLPPLLAVARQWPNRLWAIEGANGIGRPRAARLLADGERVVDVPPKLAARARVFDTGQGRKTDASDAHAIVMVALRDKGYARSRSDELMVLRLLCDRRDELSRARAQALNRLHRLFLELLPGGAPTKKSTTQYKALLAAVRPATSWGRLGAGWPPRNSPTSPHRHQAQGNEGGAESRGDGHRLATDGPARHRPRRSRPHPRRCRRHRPFPDRNHFASWTGTAPIDASSGEQIRHRLSRAGNRRLNHVLYIAGIVSSATTPPGAGLLPAKLREGKTPMEAMRCLRRRLSDAVYRQLVADRERLQPSSAEAGPGGHSGATPQSSATDLTPDVGSSDKPLPEPACATLPRAHTTPKHRGPGTAATSRRRAGGVNVQRPTGRTTLTPTSADVPSTASRIAPLTPGAIEGRHVRAFGIPR